MKNDFVPIIVFNMKCSHVGGGPGAPTILSGEWQENDL